MTESEEELTDALERYYRLWLPDVKDGDALQCAFTELMELCKEYFDEWA